MDALVTVVCFFLVLLYAGRVPSACCSRARFLLRKTRPGIHSKQNQHSGRTHGSIPDGFRILRGLDSKFCLYYLHLNITSQRITTLVYQTLSGTHLTTLVLAAASSSSVDALVLFLSDTSCTPGASPPFAPAARPLLASTGLLPVQPGGDRPVLRCFSSSVLRSSRRRPTLVLAAASSSSVDALVLFLSDTSCTPGASPPFAPAARPLLASTGLLPVQPGGDRPVLRCFSSSVLRSSRRRPVEISSFHCRFPSYVRPFSPADISTFQSCFASLPDSHPLFRSPHLLARSFILCSLLPSRLRCSHSPLWAQPQICDGGWTAIHNTVILG